MDRIVVEKTMNQPFVTRDVLHFQGKIVGKFDFTIFFVDVILLT